MGALVAMVPAEFGSNKEEKRSGWVETVWGGKANKTQTTVVHCSDMETREINAKCLDCCTEESFMWMLLTT